MGRCGSNASTAGIFTPEKHRQTKWKLDDRLAQQIADLATFIDAKTVCDFGAGAGMLVDELRKYQLDAFGLDGTAHVSTLYGGRVLEQPLHVPRHKWRRGDAVWDVVVSTHTASLIPREHEQDFLDNVFHSARKAVVLQWTETPGRGNVNPRDRGWVVDQALQRGFEESGIRTALANYNCSPPSRHTLTVFLKHGVIDQRFWVKDGGCWIPNLKEHRKAILPHAPGHARVMVDLIDNHFGLRPIMAAEIGVYLAQTSQVLCECYPGIDLLLIDPYPVDNLHEWQNFLACGRLGYKPENMLRVKRQAAERMRPYSHQVGWVYKPSVEAANLLGGSKSPQFDFVLVDGDHSYNGCLSDIKAWWPLIKHGGILAGDDLKRGRHPLHHWGVNQAVDEFCAENDLTLNEGDEKTWWIFKQ